MHNVKSSRKPETALSDLIHPYISIPSFPQLPNEKLPSSPLPNLTTQKPPRSTLWRTARILPSRSPRVLFNGKDSPVPHSRVSATIHSIRYTIRNSGLTCGRPLIPPRLLYHPEHSDMPLYGLVTFVSSSCLCRVICVLLPFRLKDLTSCVGNPRTGKHAINN
jgi:hypothetical protein